MGNKSDQSTTEHVHHDVVRVGATCIAKIDGKFFLAVEIEVEVPGIDIEPVIFIRITEKQAEILLRSGVKRCRIVDEEFWKPGEKVEFKCILVVERMAFRVFEVENKEEVLVLVRSPRCPVIGER